MEILQEKEGKYFLKSANSLKIREISDRMKTACNLLDEFNDKVVEMRGEDHE